MVENSLVFLPRHRGQGTGAYQQYMKLCHLRLMWKRRGGGGGKRWREVGQHRSSQPSSSPYRTKKAVTVVERNYFLFVLFYFYFSLKAKLIYLRKKLLLSYHYCIDILPFITLFYFCKLEMKMVQGSLFTVAKWISLYWLV